MIKGSLHTQYVNAEIPNFAQSYLLMPRGFSDRDLEDLGNGKMLVKLHQRFLPDTTLRIGATILTSGETTSRTPFRRDSLLLSSIDKFPIRHKGILSGIEVPLVLQNDKSASRQMSASAIRRNLRWATG